MHSIECDDKWRELVPELSDEETRYVKVGEVLASTNPITVSHLLNYPREPSQVRCVIIGR